VLFSAPDRFKESATFGMENNMARKNTAILAAAVVLTSAGVASAQTNSHSVRIVALGQSSEAVMLDRGCAAAAELPTFELMGFPITRHQVALLGATQIRERLPAHTLTLADMPASPHQVAVLTPHPRPTEEPATNETVSFSTR
jgi:hypothetical protein